MNKNRRKKLTKAIELLNQAKEIVETCASEERECFDNLTESLMNSEKGQKYDENASNLEECEGLFADLFINIETAME